MGFKVPWDYCFGDCSAISNILEDKPLWSPKWFIPHFVNILCRAVGQVVFANNPISGFLILVATFIPDWRVGLGTFLGASVATIGEMILRLQPWALMQNGVAALNGVLVGSVISSLYSPIFNVPMDAKMWIFICLGSLMSIFICSAFINTLGAGNNIPYFTLPFNLVAVSTFLTAQQHFGSKLSENPVDSTENAFNTTSTEIDWYQVGNGIALSMGQVYAVNDIRASSLMNFGVFLCSPLLFITSTIGAALGSLGGVALLPHEDLQEVYDGLWGYNGVIASAAITCVFFAFNTMSFVLGMANLLGAIGAQYALRATMTLQSKIPVFTLPFALVTLLMINVTDERGSLYRVKEMSYPEKQAYEWHSKIKGRASDSSDTTLPQTSREI